MCARRTTRNTAAAALLATLAVACAAPPSGPPPGGAVSAQGAATFIGRSGDGTFTVALTVVDGRASAFVTDGHDVGMRLDGAATAGLLDLADGGGSALVGGVHGRVVHGGVTPAGGAGWSFAAVQVEEPAGLYESGPLDRSDPIDRSDPADLSDPIDLSDAADRPDPGRIDWIRLPDGSTVGVAEIGGLDRTAPAMADDIVIDGLRFAAARRVTAQLGP